MSRRRWFLIFMLAFIALTQVGYMLPVPEDEAEALMEMFMSQLGDLDDEIGIAMHNLTIATAMIIPFVGTALGVFTAVETGWAFAVVNYVNDLPFEIPPALVLILTPFGIMEWIAYAIAMSRSLILTKTIIKKDQRKLLKGMIKPTLIEYGIVVALLVAGGYVEFWMIQNMDNILEGLL